MKHIDNQTYIANMESILYSTQGEMGRRVLGLHHSRHIDWEIPWANQVKGAPAGELQVKRVGVGLSHALTTFSAGAGGGMVKSLQAVAPEVSTREQQQEVTYFLDIINFCYI